MSSLDLALLEVLDAGAHMLLKRVDESIDVVLQVAGEIWSLSSEMVSAGSLKSALGVVDVLVNSVDVVALVVKWLGLPSDQLFDLGKDILVVLEDAAVQAKHLNLALDLSESLLIGASEVGVEISTEPVEQLQGLLVAHQVLHKHLVLSASLVPKLLETSVVAGNAVIDEFDVVIGGVQLVLQELGMGLGVVPVGKCFSLNGHQVGN
jgi:hypothetical protein